MKKNAPALILVDIQKGLEQLDFYGGERNNPHAEANARVLLDHWREKEWPLFHIRHCSVTPGSPLTEGLPGNAFKEIVTPLPGETVISKSVNSAFIGTDLKELLDAQGIQTLVIAGLTTQHCISTTVRMAGNYGYTTFLASDATAAFQAKGVHGEIYPAELVHQVSLATLHEEFATVLTTKEILSAVQLGSQVQH